MKSIDHPCCATGGHRGLSGKFEHSSMAWLAALAGFLVLVAPLSFAGPMAGGMAPEASEPAEVAASEQAEQGDEPAEDGEEAGAEKLAEAEAEREWLVDEGGRRYYLEPWSKERRFTRLEDGRVRFWNLMPLEVDSEDEENFYIRKYERVEVEPIQRGYKATEEDLARYEEVDWPRVDELRFQPFESGLPNRGQWRNGFELADINGDGHLDLIHSPPRKAMTTPVIFLGDSLGNWTPWEDVEFPAAPYDYGDVAVADFDGDSRLDLALAIHFTGYVIMVQSEPGVFKRWDSEVLLSPEAQRKLKEKGPFSSREIMATDWNQDGRPDLLVLSEGPSLRGLDDFTVKDGAVGIRLLLNRGDGTWKAVDSPESDHSYGDALVVADFNGDGVQDIATGSRSRGYKDVIKLGDGEGGWHSVSLDPLPGHVLVWSLATGDFDADGRTDLVVGYRDNLWGVQREAVDLLLNRSADGELRWERRHVHSHKGTQAYASVASGDVDGDGHTDLVALNGMGQPEVYLGTGDGGLRLEASPELAPSKGHEGCTGYELHLRDVNGDGRDEILAGFAGEPGSEIALTNTLDPRCPDQGALRAWTPVKRETEVGPR